MLRKISSVAVLFVLVILPAIAMGGDGMPSGKWWHNPRVSAQMNLNKDEIRRLDESFVKSRRKLIDLKSNLEKQRFELENLLEKKMLNEAAVMEQFKKMESSKNRLSTEYFRFLLQVRKILGFERYQDLKMRYKTFRQQKRLRTQKHPGANPGQTGPGPRK